MSTKPRMWAFGLIGLALIVAPLASFAQGIGQTIVAGATAELIQVVAGIISAALLGAVVALVAKRSAPALAKTPEERTMWDRLAIEAQKRVEALERDQLQQFIANFLTQTVDRWAPMVPGLSAAAAADELLTDAYESITRRNPDLAAKLGVDRQAIQKTLRDFLETGIKRATDPLARAIAPPGDPLAAALAQAGVQGVVPAS